MINLHEAFESLHDRMLKQVAETMWTIERINPMSQKETEEFQGDAVKKKLLMKSLKKELEERQENLKVVEKILQKYA